MSGETQFTEGRRQQRPLDEIAYSVDTTRYGGSPTDVSVTLYELTTPESTGTNVSSTKLSGSAGVSGNVITTPKVIGLEGGKLYRLTVEFTAGGNQYAPFVWFHGIY